MAVSKDRRKGTERRNELRVGVDADIGWTIDGTPMSGRLSDMSMAGCFVLTAGQFSDGDIVRLYFPHPDGAQVEIHGQIRNHVPEIGFGVEFLDLTGFLKEFLRSFAETHFTYR
ncbi:MAG TPA: PilZ domain-containing protein [Pyrinomonadaceae bacterium]|jgi:hypothetical protein|nr:PilZ domain-containing protein [Pyrinomonadaceae bacterium]